MGDLDRSVTLEVDLDTSKVDEGAQRYVSNVQKMAAAGAQAGKDANAAITPQLASLAQLNTQLQKIGVRYQQTGQISARALSATGAAIKELQQEYGKTASAADRLSVAERTFFMAAQQAQKDALKRLREYNEAAQEVQRQTHNWTSLGSAIEGLGGPIGRTAQVVGGVTAALTAGWQAGRHLDEWLDKNADGWAAWKTKATDAIVGVKKDLVDLATDPRFAGTRTQQLLPQIQAKQDQSKFGFNLGQALQAQGVRTIADATADVKKFEEQLNLLKIDDSFKASIGQVGTGVESFLQKSKGAVQGWAQEFTLAGHAIPNDLQGIIDKLGQVDAALTTSQSRLETIKSNQAIANQAADLQKFISGIDLKFQPPAVGPVEQAVQEVRNITLAAYADIAAKETARKQDIEAQGAAYDVLSKQIAKLKESGNTGPEAQAEIAALRAKQQVIDATVASDKNAVKALEDERVKVGLLGASLEQVRSDDALGKLAEETQKKFKALTGGIASGLKSALASVSGFGFGLNTDSSAQLEALAKQLQAKLQNAVEQGFSDADLSKIKDELDASWESGSQKIVAAAKEWADIVDQAQKNFEESIHRLGDSFGDIFVDLAETGGANFGKIAAQQFNIQLKKAGGDIAKVFGDALAGIFGGDFKATGVNAQGQQINAAGQTQAAFTKSTADMGAAISGAFAGALGTIGQTLEMFKNAQKGQQVSLIGSIVTQAAVGASIGSAFNVGLGTAIGAVVGALIGGITASIANAKAKATLAYADFGVTAGEFYIKPFQGLEDHFKNFSAKELHDFTQRVNATMDQVTSDYIGILLKFPTEVLESLGSFSARMVNSHFDPFATDYTGAHKASVEFLRDFQANFELWLTDQLPKDLAEQFRAPVAQAFEAMGMTEDGFNRIWNQLQGLDPKDAIQVLNDMADFAIGFRGALDVLNNLDNLTTSQMLSGDIGALGTVNDQNAFMTQLIAASDGVNKLLLSIAEMPFQEQAAAAAKLGTSMKEIVTNLVDYLNQIGEISKGLSESIADARFQLQLSNAASPQEKSDLLQNQLFRDYDKIQQAATLGLSPEEVQKLVTDATSIVTQLYQLDPSKRYAWADSQLANLDKYQQDALKALGDQAKTAVEQLIASVQPFADYLNGVPADIDPAIEAAKNSIFNFSAALDLLSQRIASDAGAPGGGAGGFGGGNNTGPGAYGRNPFIGTGSESNPYTNPEPRGGGQGGGETNDYTPRYGYRPPGDYPGTEGDSGGWFAKPWDRGFGPITGNGGNILPWQGARAGAQASITDPVLVTLRSVDARLAKIEANTKEGKDVRVTNRLIVESGDDTAVFEGDDGFTDRALAARGRR